MKLLCISRDYRVIALEIEQNAPLGRCIKMSCEQEPRGVGIMSVMELESRRFVFIPGPGDEFEQDLLLYEEVL